MTPRIPQVLLALALVAPAAAPTPPRLKKYVNSAYGFCVSFPRDWPSYTSVDGTGITLAPRVRAAVIKPLIRFRAGVAFAPKPGQRQTLEQSFREGVRELRSERVIGHLRVLRDDPGELHGLKARRTEVEYYLYPRHMLVLTVKTLVVGPAPYRGKFEASLSCQANRCGQMLKAYWGMVERHWAVRCVSPR